jgi:uncharacterized protein (TIRG00374 family)
MKIFAMILGLLVSAVCLYLVMCQVDLHEVWMAFKEADFIFIVWGWGFLCGFILFAALRWHFIFKAAVKSPGVKVLAGVIVMGFMGNSIFPARLGEVLRIYVLKQKYGVKKAISLSTIIIEKLYDGIVLLSILLLVLWFHQERWKEVVDALIPVQNIALAAYGAIFIYAIAITILLLMRARVRLWIRWGRLCSVDDVRDRMNFVRGITSLSQIKFVMEILAISLLMWTCAAGVILMCLKASSLELSLEAPFFVLTMISIACMLPSSPGFVGTLQFFVVAALAFYHVEQAKALGFSFLYHVVEFLPLTLIGLGLFLKSNLSWKGVQGELVS